VIPREGVESPDQLRSAVTAFRVIPREGVESPSRRDSASSAPPPQVIPREGVESYFVTSYYFYRV